MLVGSDILMQVARHSAQRGRVVPALRLELEPTKLCSRNCLVSPIPSSHSHLHSVGLTMALSMTGSYNALRQLYCGGLHRLALGTARDARDAYAFLLDELYWWQVIRAVLARVVCSDRLIFAMQACWSPSYLRSFCPSFPLLIRLLLLSPRFRFSLIASASLSVYFFELYSAFSLYLLPKSERKA